jgi:hypothetical protein
MDEFKRELVVFNTKQKEVQTAALELGSSHLLI